MQRLSVILPAYNERGNLAALLREIATVAEQLPYPMEVIVVDDGSTDGTSLEVEQIAPEVLPPLDELVLVRLKGNYGQTVATTVGILQATGDVLVLMDADRQNDPADIPKLLVKLSEGFDVVSGWRKERQDPLTKTLPSKIANAFDCVGDGRSGARFGLFVAGISGVGVANPRSGRIASPLHAHLLRRQRRPHRGSRRPPSPPNRRQVQVWLEALLCRPERFAPAHFPCPLQPNSLCGSDGDGRHDSIGHPVGFADSVVVSANLATPFDRCFRPRFRFLRVGHRRRARDAVEWQARRICPPCRRRNPSIRFPFAAPHPDRWLR